MCIVFGRFGKDSAEGEFYNAFLSTVDLSKFNTFLYPNKTEIRPVFRVKFPIKEF